MNFSFWRFRNSFFQTKRVVRNKVQFTIWMPGIIIILLQQIEKRFIIGLTRPGSKYSPWWRFSLFTRTRCNPLPSLRACEEKTWQKDKKRTKRQKREKKYKITKRQNDKKTKRRNDRIKKRQRPMREFNIVTSGQFRTFAIFFLLYKMLKPP